MSEHKNNLTTLCYIEKDNCYLMLHRVKKQRDVNKGKWIGIGGHFEDGESPEECLLREVKEETGLTLQNWCFRGMITFVFRQAQDADYVNQDEIQEDMEYMCLYTADAFEGELSVCDEGTLAWVPKSDIGKLVLWEGDRIFLSLLQTDEPFFSLKLSYVGEHLERAVLNGKDIEPETYLDARRNEYAGA